MQLSKKRITKALIRLRGCAGWSVPVLFANPRRQVFSRRGPYIIAYFMFPLVLKQSSSVLCRDAPYNNDVRLLSSVCHIHLQTALLLVL